MDNRLWMFDFSVDLGHYYSSIKKNWSFEVGIFQGLLSCDESLFPDTSLNLTSYEYKTSNFPSHLPCSAAVEVTTMCTSTSSMSAAAQSVALVASKVAQQRQRVRRHRQLHRGRKLRTTGAHQRIRNQVQHIYQQLGPTFFKQAYRMLYHSFKSLASKLQHGIIKSLHIKRRTESSSSAAVNIINYQRYVPNGPIAPSVCLACALC